MFGFKLFIENLITEYFKVKDYLETNQRAKKIFDWLFNQPEVRDFIKRIDEISIVKPLKPGKTGCLILNRSQPNTFGTSYDDDATGNTFQHRIPVKIDEFEGTELTLSRTDNKDFEEISYLTPYFPDFREKRSKKRIQVPASRVLLVNNDKYLAFTRWLAYAVSEGSLQKKMKIPRYFKYFWQRSEEGLLNSLRNDSLLSKLRTIELKPDHFFVGGDEIDIPLNYPSVNKDFRGKEGGEGEEIISFPNGFKWLNLKRKYCSKEANAAGHCGNQGGEPNDEILSLRDSENRVYLTFILNDGKLGEMKAVGNKKPDKSLHPYIIALLEKPFVTQLVGGHWLPENDFKLSDLSYEYTNRLKLKRPDLFSGVVFSKLDEMLLKNRHRLDKYIKHLISKYPILKEVKILYYDDKNNCFKVSDDKYHGIYSISQEVSKGSTNWLRIISRIFRNKDPDRSIDRLAIQNSFFRHLSPGELQEVKSYLLSIKNEEYERTAFGSVKSKEDFKKAIDRLFKIDDNDDESYEIWRSLKFASKYDKNLSVVLDRVKRSSVKNSVEKEINKKLRNCKNDYGFFFQIKVDKSGYISMEKCIDANDIYQIMKTKNFDKNHDAGYCLDEYDEISVDEARFVEELRKNLKYLHYRIESD